MIYSFDPIFDENSKALILGSMASVKSLEEGFYYMHPRNRFWKTIGEVAGSEVPGSIEGKKAWLKANNIALMDIIYSCERNGSLDSDIKKVVPNDITKVLKTANIKGIFCNGKKSFEIAKKTYPDLQFICLPSTSPANAGGWNKDEWMKVRGCLTDNRDLQN